MDSSFEDLKAFRGLNETNTGELHFVSPTEEDSEINENIKEKRSFIGEAACLWLKEEK